jgi:4-aminobutyrate aminotransferase-like enzyme
VPAGDRPPRVRGPVPGPRSRELGRRLRRVESRNITRVDDHGPIFWQEAAGANVGDVDGNLYVDLTGGFGVAAAGHGNPAVASAASSQLHRLAHAMGDVHPAAVKVELLERLAELAPGDLSVAILSANGSDAVESALKTASLATGRPGVVAFHGGYHGLGYGALGVTAGSFFRGPFEAQLYPGVRFAPFPRLPDQSPTAGRDPAPVHPTSETALRVVREHVLQSVESGDPVGAVIVEPVQGRGGILVPEPEFLPGLRALCDELDVVLILDEIYTGFGRTGRWFACGHWDVVPDLLVMGKALSGGLPLSAVIGAPEVMDAWPPSGGEAIHTSTFLGNPVACAAALAHLREIEEHDLVGRAAGLGGRLAARLAEIVDRTGAATGARGLGLMRALELGNAGDDAPARVVRALLEAGIIVLAEGSALAFTPPLVITEDQLDGALDAVETAVAALGGEA